MRSHLETSKVNFNSSYRPLLAGLSDVQEKIYLQKATQIQHYKFQSHRSNY
jgi:hypothetical protein